MTDLEQARLEIAKKAEDDNEFQFAREVRTGAWDRRADVQATRLRIKLERMKK